MLAGAAFHNENEFIITRRTSEQGTRFSRAGCEGNCAIIRRCEPTAAKWKILKYLKHENSRRRLVIISAVSLLFPPQHRQFSHPGRLIGVFMLCLRFMHRLPAQVSQSASHHLYSKCSFPSRTWPRFLFTFYGGH